MFLFFGDLTSARYHPTGTSNSVRGLFQGGSSPLQSVIDYITIASTGNGADFGDLTAGKRSGGSSSDSHGGLQA